MKTQLTHYQLAIRPYYRQFRTPLQTTYGLWKVREGILLQLKHPTGKIFWGEIAPIPWFGSESFDQALTFCQDLPKQLSSQQLAAIPDHLPACQFGFGAALGGLSQHPQQLPLERLSALLAAGEAALTSWPSLWQQGYRTMKWKIGVLPLAEEIDVFRQLLTQLPPGGRLRLDANGGLTQDEASYWLEQCDVWLQQRSSSQATIEFFEQPLPIHQFKAMQSLGDRYRTPLALDESVATLPQLQQCYQQGWRGIYVIKPSLIGAPIELRQFCQAHPIDAVFSSAFETTIGRQAGLNLATELANPDRALGYGVNHWFNQEEAFDFHQLWQSL